MMEAEDNLDAAASSELLEVEDFVQLQYATLYPDWINSYDTADLDNEAAMIREEYYAAKDEKVKELNDFLDRPGQSKRTIKSGCRHRVQEIVELIIAYQEDGEALYKGGSGSLD